VSVWKAIEFYTLLGRSTESRYTQLGPYWAQRSYFNMLSRSYIPTGVFCLLIATSAASYGGTFYIDFATGNDSNNGTSKTTPWKNHPYMRSWTGSYTHSAGDRFIFRGGAVWTASAFPMTIPGGGTQGSPDYYGVDQSWFSGSSWAKPIFDAQNTIPAGGSMVVFGASAQWDTLDNIEVRNMRIDNSSGALDHCLIQFMYGAMNVTIQNALVHTWTVTTAGKYDQMGGICGLGPMTNVVVDHTTVFDDDATANKVSACTFNIDVVSFSTIHDCVEGVFGGRIDHDNLIYNIYKSTDGTAHENGLQAQNANCQIYNNVLHDVFNGTALYIVGDSGSSAAGTCNIYNNVVYNSVVTNINLDMDQASSGNLNVNVFNNSLDSGGSGTVVRTTPRGTRWNTVTVRNNHYITDGSTGEDIPAGTSNSLNDSNNLLMSHLVATLQGILPGNLYAPTAITNSTVGFGVNLTSLNIPSLTADRIGTARPGSGAWDAGAYQYGGGGGGGKPLPPTTLAVIVR
jgi:hypothetical protein